MPDLTTTVDKIWKHKPWIKWSWKEGRGDSDIAKYALNFKQSDTIKLSEVLENCDIFSAVWFLRCFDYKEYCLLCAWIAEIGLSTYEEYYPKDDRLRKAIEEIKLYYYGHSSKNKLKKCHEHVEKASKAAFDLEYYKTWGQKNYKIDDIKHHCSITAPSRVAHFVHNAIDLQMSYDISLGQRKDAEKLMKKFIEM